MSRTFPTHTITDDSSLGGSVIKRSLRFNNPSSSADDATLTRTVGTASNRKTYTHSFWVKRTKLGYGMIFGQTDGSGNDFCNFVFNSDNKIEFNEYIYSSGGNKFRLITTRVFRDITSWYHIVTVVDTTQGTSSNRVKIYVNGVQETSFTTGIYPDQNHDTFINGTSYDTMRIGLNGWGYGGANCYLAEFNAVDGYAYDPSYFGYTEFQTGIWRPKRYEGAYGTNGYHLDFSDNSSTAALGIDKSPNGNDFTVTNFSVSSGIDNDSFTTHTPTSKNEFATLNSNLQTSSGAQYRNGNYTFYMTHDGTHMRSSSNMSVNSGKWYAEFKLTTYSFQSGSYPYIGVCADDLWKNSWVGDDGTSYQTGGGIWRNGSNIEGTGVTYTQGDTISVAIDLDQGTPKVWWAKNGTYIKSGNPATNANGTDIAPTSNTGYYNFAISLWASTGQWDANFGQRAFSYDVPSGFKTLCTDNIRSTQSIIPQKHFETLIYTGDGTATRSISGLEFKPDLVWIKNRSQTDWHILGDSVRGFPKTIYSNRTEAEVNGAGSGENGHIASAHDHGFIVKDDDGTVGGNCNANGENYVAWCWKAGGAAVTNNDGTVTSSVSANQAAGFSIVSYVVPSGSGYSVGHGLGAVPKLILAKNRDTNSNWDVYSAFIPNTKRLKLNSDAAEETQPAWNNQTATSTVFYSLGGGSWHGVGGNMINYVFCDVPGYSKFGTYRGNGNADGMFIYTGFSPAFIMVKRVDSSNMWLMMDNKRYSYNVHGVGLKANDNSAEFGWNPSKDFLSNGFKVRTSDSAENTDGGTYLYMAFADQTALTAFDQANLNAR